MDIGGAMAFVRDNSDGTFVTLHADGRPHVSVVSGLPIDGHLWISSTRTRVKTKNVRRDPRVVFQCGTGPWVAIEGSASLREGDGILDELRRHYRTLKGEHEDWEEFDRAMIADQRLLIDVEPLRAYGWGL